MPVSDPDVVESRIRLARGAWAFIGLAPLLVAAAIKLAAVDREFLIALYPLTGGIIAAGIAALYWLATGRVVVTATDVRIERRRGTRTIALADVAKVEQRGARRAANEHILIVRHDRRRVRLYNLAREDAVASAIAGRIDQKPPPRTYDLLGREYRPLGWRTLLACMFMWLVVGAGAAIAGQANGWCAVNLLSIPLGWILLTFAHELGHAIAARRMGFGVSWIAVGTGPHLGSLRLAGFRVEVFALPISGETMVAMRGRHDLRRRLSVVSAGGPIVDVVVAGASLLVILVGGWPNFVAEPAPQMALAYAALSGLAATAVGGAHGLVTDVVHLSEYARLTDAELARRYGTDD